MWSTIGSGVDEQLDRLEAHLAALTAQQREHSTALVAARDDVDQLTREARAAARDGALKQAEGGKPASTAKLEAQLDAARDQLPVINDQLQATLEAIGAKEAELGSYVARNVDRLMDQHGNGAETAKTGVEQALNVLLDAMKEWIRVAQQADRLTGGTQAHRRVRSPDLPEQLEHVRSAMRHGITVPLPVAREFTEPSYTVQMPPGAPEIEIDDHNPGVDKHGHPGKNWERVK